MNKYFTKIVTLIIGLSVGAIIYFSLWSIFVYFGFVN